MSNKKGKFQKIEPRKKRKFKLSPLHKKVIAYLIVIVLLITVPMTIKSTKDKEKHEIEIAQLVEQYETRIQEIEEGHRAEIFALNQEHEYGGNVSDIEREAEYISKVVYGMGKNHDVNSQKAIVWCVLNRVESPGYSNDIVEVCRQAHQWIDYSDDNPVIESIYDMVLEILKNWHNEGHRPMSKDFIYLSWSSDEILLRDTYEVTKSTRYWRFY